MTSGDKPSRGMGEGAVLETGPGRGLPLQLTSFIGREQEIAEVKRLLVSARLLTLLGAGGIGKTRLALRVATDMMEAGEYEDGVWFVDLAPLTDPRQVSQAIASSLGVREQAGRSLVDTLKEYLREGDLLLVLDNCEHVAEECAQLADALLRACPDVRILVTSRQVLGVGGEMIYRVPPLSLPDVRSYSKDGARRALSLEELEQYEGIRLFVERARLKQQGFNLTLENAEHVVRLCNRLDGLPLAIELAAARTPVLSVKQIVERLGTPFRMLRDSVAFVSARQRTLAATVEWSYDLLTNAEQVLFRRLSVFAGSFPLEAVEAVCGLEADESDILGLLSQLIDKSLVNMEEWAGKERGGWQARYRMLETIRQYAWEKLQHPEGTRHPEEVGEVRARHLRWYMELAETARPELDGPDQKEWLDRLEVEHDNMRAALAWSQINETGDASALEAGARMAAALSWFWYVRGYLSEGRRWLEWLLERGESLPKPLRARAAHGAATLARNQGAFEQAVAWYNQALELFRELDDRQMVAHALNNLGIVATAQADYERAMALLEESLSIEQALGRKGGAASLLNNLANIATDLGDFERARGYQREALQLAREMGHQRGIAIVLNNLAHTERCLGNYQAARALIEESLAIRRELGDKVGIASSMNRLAEVEFYCSNYEVARQLLNEGLEMLQEIGVHEWIAGWLINLGEVARCEGNLDEAARWLEEALSVAREFNDRWAVVEALESLGRTVHSGGAHPQAQSLFHKALEMAQQGTLSAPSHLRAQSLFHEALEMAQQLGTKVLIAKCLAGLAGVAVAANQFDRAARLAAAAERLLEVTGYKLHQVDARELDHTMQVCRNRLGKAWETAREEGRAMPLEQAVELARQELPQEAFPSVPAASERQPAATGRALSAPAHHYELSQREVEVLRLVAEGLSNDQIAERLFLSTHTVRAHLHSINGKLDVSSRGAAVRLAIDHGLI